MSIVSHLHQLFNAETGLHYRSRPLYDHLETW
jgi:hypothetical protein